MWKSDISNIREKEIDMMFPHTVFLSELRDDSKYVIWNENYLLMGDDSGKGGYDVFKAFSVTFLDLMTNLRVRNLISLETFVLVKDDLYYFIKKMYFCEVIMPTKHTYVIGNIAESLGVYYSKYDYWNIVLGAMIKAPYAYLKILIKKIFKYFEGRALLCQEQEL